MIITEIKPGAEGLAGGNLPDQESLKRVANLAEGKQLKDITQVDSVFNEFIRTTRFMNENDSLRYQRFVTLLLQTAFDNLAILHDKETLLTQIRADGDYQDCVQYELVNPDMVEQDLLRAEVALLSALYHSVVNDWNLQQDV